MQPIIVFFTCLALFGPVQSRCDRNGIANEIVASLSTIAGDLAKIEHNEQIVWHSNDLCANACKANGTGRIVAKFASIQEQVCAISLRLNMLAVASEHRRLT